MKAFRDYFVLGAIALLLSELTYPHVASLTGWTQPTDAVSLHEHHRALTAAVKDLQAKTYREHVLQLPEDANAWHTTVVYDAKTPVDAPSRQLAANMAATPRLQSLAAQTKLHVFTPQDPLFRDRVSVYYGTTFPQIIVQAGDGQVVYKASGANIPAHGEELADHIATAIRNCDRCRPRPNPQPNPQPTPAPVTPPAIPDIGPTNPADSSERNIPVWLYLIPIVTGALGAFSQAKKEA